MVTLIIKHVLPDGTTAGYHGDSFCSIASEARRAKSITTESSQNERAQKWIANVRRNFEGIWNDEESSHYKSYLIWKGYSLQEIQTVFEELPV